MSKEGRINLPPGFRFKPRDDELINFYLKPRIMGRKLPCKIINDGVQVYAPDSTPWLLFDINDPDSWIDSITNAEKTLYVFTSLSKIAATHSNNTTSRTRKNTSKRAGCGTWVQRSQRLPIIDRKGNLIGGKRMLNFEIHEAEYDLDKAVYFKMHEYSLWGVNQDLGSKGGDNLVLCEITFNPSKKSHSKLVINSPDQVSKQGPKPRYKKQCNKNVDGSNTLSSNVCEESTSSHPGSLVALGGGDGSGNWAGNPYDISVQNLDEFGGVLCSADQHGEGSEDLSLEFYNIVGNSSESVPVMISNVYHESTSSHPGSLVTLGGGVGSDDWAGTPSYDIGVQNLDKFAGVLCSGDQSGEGMCFGYQDGEDLSLDFFNVAGNSSEIVPVMSSNVYQESTSSHPGSLVALSSYDIGVPNLDEFGGVLCSDNQGGEGLSFGAQGGEDPSVDFFDIARYMEDMKSNPEVESVQDGTISGLGKRKYAEGDSSCQAKLRNCVYSKNKAKRLRI